MPQYSPPLAEFRFLLDGVFSYEHAFCELPGWEDVDLDVVLATLDAAGEFSRDFLLPSNLQGDRQGCRVEGGRVRTPDGYKLAYKAFCRGGWPGLAAHAEYGGQELPPSLAVLVREIFASGSMAFGMYAGLSQSAYRAIQAHGTQEVKAALLPHLADGSWTGTMCLTEPQAGSDLSTLRARAVPRGDDTYSVSGSKIFISGGDHDLSENIVHLVLARLPDAPAGTRGISLFAVPKFWPSKQGTASKLSPNEVVCTSLEHKMGIRGSATATLSFEGARGWLLGAPHGGLAAMFTMMNSSRLGVAVQSVGVAELALQNARTYAQERRQGRAPASKTPDGMQDSIIAHPDVRRKILTMKALVEGCRALYVENALALDVRARHPDESVRQAADRQLGLVTPVLKAFISDCAVEAAQLGMSVFGGHGFIHETGMEQLVRDASIVPLYEGTNGIQALGLVQRQLPAAQGSVVKEYLQQLLAVADACSANCSEMAERLREAASSLEEATQVMLARAKDDPSAAAAAASDYLRLFGLVACGAAWLRMADAATTRGGTQSPDFYSGKLATATFYFERVLPETMRLSQAVRWGVDSILNAAAEHL